MGVPRHTRIIVIPNDDGTSREYGISRRAVIVLAGLSLTLVLVIIGLMVSFASIQDERGRIHQLEGALTEAATTRQLAAELQVELESSRDIQEKLLMMLGVQEIHPAQRDTVASWLISTPGSSAEALQRAASVVLSPAPERWPTGGYVTKEFNSGHVARGIKPHQGIDIAGPVDTPILASASGRVARTGSDEFLGNFVEIEHGLGYLTVYGHLSRIAVARNDRVETGQVVAYMGESGQTTGPHLHFEIWHQGEAVDPRTVVAGDPPQN